MQLKTYPIACLTQNTFPEMFRFVSKNENRLTRKMTQVFGYVCNDIPLSGFGDNYETPGKLSNVNLLAAGDSTSVSHKV